MLYSPSSVAINCIPCLDTVIDFMVPLVQHGDDILVPTTFANFTSLFSPRPVGNVSASGVDGISIISVWTVVVPLTLLAELDDVQVSGVEVTILIDGASPRTFIT